jgi:hypothetical protein
MRSLGAILGPAVRLEIAHEGAGDFGRQFDWLARHAINVFVSLRKTTENARQKVYFSRDSVHSEDEAALNLIGARGKASAEPAPA